MILCCGCSHIAPLDPRLTADCERPVLDGETWRDVGMLAIEQDAALQKCTDRMRAIREVAK